MFVKASKKQARLRLALVGTSGSGKTYSALAIATGIGGRIAVIDSERASASKYADRFAFDCCELDSFNPGAYVTAIQAAEKAGYDVLIIDSLSHAWMGKEGALEQVDNAVKRSKSGNSFAAWREVTPMHNALVDAILRSRCHIIATMRTKTEYVIEEVNGKKVPRKVGMAPVQRDGVEYEFDVVGDLDDTTLAITKTRCSALSKAVISQPGIELGKTLIAWLTDGAPVPGATAPAVVPAPAAIAAIPTHVAHPPLDDGWNGEEEDGIEAAINGAPTKDALVGLVPRIKMEKVEVQKGLRILYGKRLKALKASSANGLAA